MTRVDAPGADASPVDGGAALAEAQKMLAFYRAKVDTLAAEGLKADHKLAVLARQLRERRIGFSLLAEMHLRMAEQRDLQTTMAAAAEAIRGKLLVDRVVVFVREDSCFRPAQWFGFSPPEIEQTRVLELGLDVAPEGVTAFLVSEHPDADAHSAESLPAALGVGPVVVIPVASAGTPLALVVIGRTRKHAVAEMPFEEGDQETFRAISAMLSATVENLLAEEAKRQLEVQMSGGFAHEIRNSLSAARLVLRRAQEGELTLPEENVRLGGAIFAIVRERLDDAEREGVAEHLRALLRNERTVHEVLAQATVATERGLAIAQQIMDYARVGATARGRETVDVGAVVSAVIGEVDGDARRRGIDVRVELEAATCVADPVHVHSIVSNLLRNAVDAAAGVTRVREPTVVVRTTRGEREIEILVTDNGTGIKPEHRRRIFEPFFSTKPDTGTGLGLGVVRKLVTLYGGRLTFESTVDVGSTFRVHLPFEGTR